MASISVGILLLLSIQFLSLSAIEPPVDPLPELINAYLTFYGCVIQCYRDSFGVKATGDNPCTEKPHIGPFGKGQSFSFKQVKKSFYCITKTCNSKVPKYLCESIPLNDQPNKSGANSDNNAYNGHHLDDGSDDNDNCDDDCVYYCDDGGNSNKGPKKDKGSSMNENGDSCSDADPDESCDCDEDCCDEYGDGDEYCDCSDCDDENMEDNAASQSTGTANSQGAEAWAESYSSSGSHGNSGSNPSSGNDGVQNRPTNVRNNNYWNNGQAQTRSFSENKNNKASDDKSTIKSNKESYLITFFKRFMLKSNLPTPQTDADVVSAATTDCDSTEGETITTATDTTTDCYSTEGETIATDSTTDCDSTEGETITTATDTTTDFYSTVDETFATESTTNCDDSVESTVTSTFPNNNGEGFIKNSPASSHSWSSAQSRTGSISNGNPGYNNLNTPEVNKNYNWDSQPNILRYYGDNRNYFARHLPLAGNGNPNAWLQTTDYLNGWVPDAQQPLLPDQTKVLNSNIVYNKMPYNSNGLLSNPQNIEVQDFQNMQVLPQKDAENTQQIFWPQNHLSYAQHPNIYNYPPGSVPESSQSYLQNPFFQSMPFVSASRGVANNGQPRSVIISDAASSSNAVNGDKSGSNTQTLSQSQWQNQNAYPRDNSGINLYSWMRGGPSNPQNFFISKTQQDEIRGVANNDQPSSGVYSASISDSESGNVRHGDTSGGNTQSRLQKQMQNQNKFNRYSWMRGGSPNPQNLFLSKTQQDEIRANNDQPSSGVHSASTSDSESGNVRHGDTYGGYTQPRLQQNQNTYSGDNSGINKYPWMKEDPFNPQSLLISKQQQEGTVVHKYERENVQ